MKAYNTKIQGIWRLVVKQLLILQALSWIDTLLHDLLWRKVNLWKSKKQTWLMQLLTDNNICE